jgi:23S rRNA (guanosine2251-2'-O)-methyltransferase
MAATPPRHKRGKPPSKSMGKSPSKSPSKSRGKSAPGDARKPQPRSPQPRSPQPRAPQGSGNRGPRPRAGDGWIYGRHAVSAALQNPARRLERLMLSREAEETLAQAGITPGISPEIRALQEITALLPEGAVHQGFALMAAPLIEPHLEDVIAALPAGDSGLVIVLDQVTDPRNVGAILRSAAAFGASAVILPERRGAETTAALAKTASGALESVPLVRVTNISRALDTLKAGGFWCVGLDAHAAQSLAKTDLSGRVALVLGAEGSGLRRLVAEHCDIRACLPIGPLIDSLNVSAAAAIALYEVARRRA